MKGFLSSLDISSGVVRDAFIDGLEAAAQGLRRKNISSASIHRIRKELKRARAILRLLRPSMGARAYHRENFILRDAGRPLTPVRDAKVLVHTLALLARKRDGPELAALWRELRRLLLEEERKRRKAVSRRQMLDAARTLRTAARRAEVFARTLPDRLALDRALGRIYKRGRKFLALVERHPTDANLHEWRKQVQYLFNQLDVLHSAGVSGLRKSRKRAQRLAGLLGSDHDLAVLGGKIAEFSARGLFPAELTPKGKWRARTKRDRSALQLEALPLGRRLYPMSAHGFKAGLRHKR